MFMNILVIGQQFEDKEMKMSAVLPFSFLHDHDTQLVQFISKLTVGWRKFLIFKNV